MRLNSDLRLLSLAVGALLTADFSAVAAQADSGAASSPASSGTDSLEPSTYEGWKQFRLLCDRCHGEEARGTSFGPDLLPAFRAGGVATTAAAFRAFIAAGRPDKGMPSASTLGLSDAHVDGVFQYLQGRSAGRFKGGRPTLNKP